MQNIYETERLYQQLSCVKVLTLKYITHPYQIMPKCTTY